MRTGVLLAVLACSALARAESPRRKPGTPDTPIAALRVIAKAEVLERQTLFRETMGWYEQAKGLAPDQPNIYYNLGRAWLFRGSHHDAADAFRKYLELAPKAADRAAVQKLVDELDHHVPSLTVEAHDFATSDPGDVVLLDGVVMGPAPITLHPAVGTHIIERIGPKRYAREWFEVEAGRDDATTDPTREVGTTSGNVVLDGLQPFENNGAWTEHGVAFATGRRIQLPLGHYKTLGQVHPDDKPLCKPVEFDVRSTTELLHVHVTIDDRARQDADATCIPVTNVVRNTPLHGAPP
ncbi:MAG: tetratricopeptide repeat protein [Kofleriaceae bacterium]